MASPLKRDMGIALLLVLWVLAFLSVVVGEFCYGMRTEVNITRNFKEDTEAYYIAYAGLERAIKEIVKSILKPPLPQSPEGDEGGKEGSKKEGSGEEEKKIDWRVNADIPPIPFASGSFKVRIGNESGKININLAGDSTLRMVLGNFDLDESEKDTIVDSILDWRDRDNLHRINGAEDDYYHSLPRPYDCKNADFDSVHELLLVRGITPDIYEKLKDLFTVYPKSGPVSRSRGGATNKININAASPQMLRALPNMTDDLVEALIDYRKEKDFTSLTQVFSIVGPEVYDSIARFLTHKMGPYYTIDAIGMVNGSNTRVGIRAVVKIDTAKGIGFSIVEWDDRPATGLVFRGTTSNEGGSL